MPRARPVGLVDLDYGAAKKPPWPSAGLKRAGTCSTKRLTAISDRVPITESWTPVIPASVR